MRERTVVERQGESLLEKDIKRHWTESLGAVVLLFVWVKITAALLMILMFHKEAGLDVSAEAMTAVVGVLSPMWTILTKEVVALVITRDKMGSGKDVKG